MKIRRALSHHGGALRYGGDEQAAELLKGAFERAAADDPNRLSHAFHSYPARMHPSIARAVLEDFSDAGELIVDPFAGSGTIPIEAMLGGLRAIGLDRSPLAVRLARVKATPLTREDAARLGELVRIISELSEERVRSRTNVVAPLPREEVRYYEGHILKELAGLREEILANTAEESFDRELGLMVFSSIILKFSRQEAETRDNLVEKRLRKGLVTEFFTRKFIETVGRLRALDEALPEDAIPAAFFEADALDMLERLKTRRADLIFTSPPYGGVYNYRDHHARRYPWLGIDPSRLERDEFGAKRSFFSRSSTRKWERAVVQMLRSFREALSEEGRVVLMIGDAIIGGEILPAEEQIARFAEQAGLVPIAYVSEAKRGAPEDRRRPEEHLIYLERRG